MFYLFKRPKNNKPSELACICKTPKRLAWWLWFKIEYTSDIELYKKSDYHAPPEMTLEKRKGDCEDVAWVAYATLRELRYNDVHLISLHTHEYGHMICVYRDSLGWQFIDTATRYTRCDEATNLRDVSTVACSGWDMMIEWEVDKNKLKQKNTHHRIKSGQYKTFKGANSG